jgi:DNA repair protein RadC
MAADRHWPQVFNDPRPDLWVHTTRTFFPYPRASHMMAHHPLGSRNSMAERRKELSEAADLSLFAPSAGPDEAPDHIGHRQRLRDRFLASGADSLQDYELLELLLFAAIPRRDTKPIAKALLRKFGSFGEVISADPRDLAEVKGIGENAVAILKTVQAAAQLLLRTQVKDMPVISSWNAMLDYCTAQMAYDGTEQFRLLFLDRKNRLIADEAQQKGTVDHTPVYPREVVKRALELNASALIMVHN